MSRFRTGGVRPRRPRPQSSPGGHIARRACVDASLFRRLALGLLFDLRTIPEVSQRGRENNGPSLLLKTACVWAVTANPAPRSSGDPAGTDWRPPTSVASTRYSPTPPLSLRLSALAATHGPMPTGRLHPAESTYHRRTRNWLSERRDPARRLRRF